MKKCRTPRAASVSRAFLAAASLALCAALPLAAAPAAALAGPLVSANFPAADSLTPYAREALASLSTFQLSNGIPVVVRSNDASPVRHIELILRGGARAAGPATAGYELLALRTMLRGSAGHSYDEIQSMLDEMSAGMTAVANLDYSSYSLSSLDKYFAKLLPVWASTLTAPLFKQGDFDQVLSEARLAWQNKEKDPWARTGRQMNALFFAGHPYAPSPDGTKESLAAASLDAVKAWYASSFSADRIFVVASGDFDPVALRADLEAALGTIPDRHAGFPGKAPAIVAPGGFLKVEHPQSRGVAYVRGDFPAPPPSSPDFMPLNVGMRMYSDLLNDVVREKYGAVYTPSAYIRAMDANYGSITMYKTNKTGKIKAYIDEATDDFAAGRVLAVESAGGEGGSPRTTIEEALEVYKAKYSNEYFLKLQRNAAVADLIAQSVVTQGDCRSWILDQQRIEAVTADQVRATMARCLLAAKITWVVLGSADTLVPVVEADYQGLGSTK